MSEENTIARKTDERFMRAALYEARHAAESGEVPVGACGSVQRAHNRAWP